MKPEFHRGAPRSVDTDVRRAYAVLMDVELTPEHEDLIRLGIEQGRYRDSADAVHRAIDLWVEGERCRLELLASLDEAADSIEAGEFTEYSEETLAQLPSDVADRCKARLAVHACASA